jgi:hypothetical protein
MERYKKEFKEENLLVYYKLLIGHSNELINLISSLQKDLKKFSYIKNDSLLSTLCYDLEKSLDAPLKKAITLKQYCEDSI